MAIYNNETDPNVKQWEQEQSKASSTYQQWWEQNKERILAEDKLNHDMQFKSKFIQNGDY